MSVESMLLKSAINATGDESITDVAEFQPKGTAGATVAGAAIGSAAGGAATGGSSWGHGIGAATGILIGQAATDLSEDLPPYICVAISPTEVYVLGMKSLRHSHLDPIAKIDRDKLGVEIHQRVSVRTVVLEDLDTGHKIPLEAPKLNVYHAKAMVELLQANEAYQDEEQHPEPVE